MYGGNENDKQTEIIIGTLAPEQKDGWCSFADGVFKYIYWQKSLVFWIELHRFFPELHLKINQHWRRTTDDPVQWRMHASPGFCIIKAIWNCPNLLANGRAAVIWKLCCHWTKVLRQRQIAVYICSNTCSWSHWVNTHTDIQILIHILVCIYTCIYISQICKMRRYEITCIKFQGI